MGRLEGKVAIISVGASGTGRAASKLFAAEGAKVAALDVNEEGLKSLAEEVRSCGGTIFVEKADLTSRDEIFSAVDDIVKEFGTVDVLFNNVGGTMRADAGFADITPEVLDFSLKLNAEGPLYLTQACLPYMVKQKKGSVIFTSSGASFSGDFFTTAYAISKGCVNTMYKYVATQYGREGIRCNLIMPGLSVNEKMAALPKDVLASFTVQNLLPEAVYPENVAEAALFLASDESSRITGAQLNVDAGMTAHMPTYADTMRASFDRSGIGADK
jgi:NAD(P)-dependent dehydrogenase (short-subunit alcohol dehydrogenase family)